MLIKWVATVAVLAATLLARSASALPRDHMVESTDSAGAFCLANAEHAAPIIVDEADWPGVTRAAKDLSIDVQRVTGRAPVVLSADASPPRTAVLVGTLGKSPLIDRLTRSGKLNVDKVAGQWESYVISVVSQPLPGIDQALVIAGSDKRGTIYGIYDVSENIGVSPWYWWADVPPLHREAIYIRAGHIIQGPPAVKYRGIFINDEAPCLTGWAKKQFGGLNSQFYTKVFELLLRLRANYLWPAMWGNAFNEDDADNACLADEYGIVMGTSHQEPMLRAQAEFDRKFKPALWNYATHPDVMEKFWREGVRRNRAYESIITMGMRGRNDTEMLEHATIQQSSDLLEKIVAKQRQILAEEVNPDLTQVPQMWCLYKEVQDYYNNGLRVPDDITLLWAEDNWGNLRRVPTPEERKRPGGSGIYYHFDYVGGPRSYKWLNTNPLPKIQEQMDIAYQFGADRIWIVNVGDLKPMELPIHFFLAKAWDPDGLSKQKVAEFTRRWAAQQFGPEHADDIADVISAYGKYNGWRKPELIDPKTFSLLHYNEAERVEAAWTDLVAKAEVINEALPADQREAYFQLVLYPVKACATVTQLYVAAGRNALYASQGRASANVQAEQVRRLFALDAALSRTYNNLGNGKWRHMMDQTHIGYTSWADPKQNNIPAVKSITPSDDSAIGVAVEGTAKASGDGELVLPAIDSMADQRRWADVFSRGSKPTQFTVKTSEPWVKVEPVQGDTTADVRLSVSIDWAHAPKGDTIAAITVNADGNQAVRFTVPVVNQPEVTKKSDRCFGSLTESFSIPADGFEKKTAATGVEWQALPDYGRVKNAMAAFPVTAPSSDPGTGPCLQYAAYFARSGDTPVNVVIAPTLPFVAGRGLRLAASIDDDDPVVVDAKMEASYADKHWGRAVSDNARTLVFNLRIKEPGRHLIKLWMVDPGVVVQQIIVGQPKPSYFGPPAADRQ